MSNSADPLVTIAIPTYNRAARFLKYALKSAVAQTYENVQILVSDNSSTDNTEELVSEIADSRVEYVKHRENIGANNNWNYCLQQARGRYFHLLHDDDLIDSRFVATCMEAIARDEEPGLIRTGTRVIDDIGNVRSSRLNQASGNTVSDLIRAWFERRTSLYLCSTLYHTEGLREVGGLQSKKNLYQDVVAVVKVAAQRGHTGVPEVLASFRRHGANAGSAAEIGDWCDDALYVLDVMCEVAPDDARWIRSIGMPYFCKQNYGRALRLASWADRWKALLVTYRKFQYVHSPVRYVSMRQAKRIRAAFGGSFGRPSRTAR